MTKPFMEMKFELVPVPVKDIDASKEFYVDKLGFEVDVDLNKEGVRLIQLTPHGSACSIMLSQGIPDVADMQPGSLRALHLVVANVAKARELLLKQGVQVEAIEDHPQGIRYAYFSDPDGNSWALQEMPWRTDEFHTS